jgi:heme/copper-type cytochrome/quinol oxidase subunit 4
MSVASLVGLRPEAGGLIGNWSPGIGDPSLMGWVTVALYFYAAYRCYRLASGKVTKLVGGERGVWWLFTLALLALGINKQLDLQTALTEIGRILAHEQGWYDNRHVVQAEFIGLVALLGLAAIVLLVWMTRRMPKATRLAVVGGVALVGFVAIRAASFHHFDRLIGRDFLGLRANWILEIGSIAIILAAAHLRPRAKR